MQKSLFERETLLLGSILIQHGLQNVYLVFLLNRRPLQILKLCRVVDSNHSLWLSTSHLTTLKLHMILTKTSTRTDMSSSSQERLISLSPNLIFRRTPFYFVTYGPFCNPIGLQYTLQRKQLNVDQTLFARA